MCLMVRNTSFWDWAVWSLLKSSGDALFVSPASGIKMSWGTGTWALCPRSQSSGRWGLCSQHQTQVSAELLNSFLCSWPVLKEE